MDHSGIKKKAIQFNGDAAYVFAMTDTTTKLELRQKFASTRTLN